MITGGVLRSRRPEVSLRLDRRAFTVTAVMMALLAGVCVVALSTGEYPVPAREVLAALVGNGSPGMDFIVLELRLPRVLTAVLTGAALAVSGALMQSLTRNPLGSPDVIGFTNGSATGALVVIIVLDGGMTDIAFGALVGGVATAVVVYLLALRRGVEGFRFILVGIGVSAMLLAANSYLITQAAWQEGIEAQAWLIGTLNDVSWEHATVVGLTVAVLVPAALSQHRELALLEMGDAVAIALGVRVERARVVLIGASVTLSAVATAATGPIAFVALAAPQLARRLTRATSPGMMSSAAMGALLLTASDLAVQRVFAPALLPVGVATGSIGGLYLIWLLTTQWRGERP